MFPLRLDTTIPKTDVIILFFVDNLSKKSSIFSVELRTVLIKRKLDECIVQSASTSSCMPNNILVDYERNGSVRKYKNFIENILKLFAQLKDRGQTTSTKMSFFLHPAISCFKCV